MSVTPLYNEFPSFLKRYFPYKVQKIFVECRVYLSQP